jgi:hypothetical protein
LLVRETPPDAVVPPEFAETPFERAPFDEHAPQIVAHRQTDQTTCLGAADFMAPTRKGRR